MSPQPLHPVSSLGSTSISLSQSTPVIRRGRCIGFLLDIADETLLYRFNRLVFVLAISRLGWQSLLLLVKSLVIQRLTYEIHSRE